MGCVKYELSLNEYVIKRYNHVVLLIWRRKKERKRCGTNSFYPFSRASLSPQINKC
jgi:hypothetical protein